MLAALTVTERCSKLTLTELGSSFYTPLQADQAMGAGPPVT